MLEPVYLVRHGQSEWNLLGLTQGQRPAPGLTVRGRAESTGAAEMVAADLRAAGLRPGVVVTSDLMRAVETAELVADRLGVGVRVDARLREQGLGRLEGSSRAETRVHLEARGQDGSGSADLGVEPLWQVQERMAAVIEDHTGGVAILVSHGDSMRALIAGLRGVSLSEAHRIDVPNGAVARVTDEVRWLPQ